MRANYPAIDTREASLVDSGAVVTAAGVSLCIDRDPLFAGARARPRGRGRNRRILEYRGARRANAAEFPMAHASSANKRA